MENKTQNSHYVARHLTRPWEFGQRRLWVYDFERDRFSEVSSKKLLVTDTPWDDAIEDWLNRYLETPLSGFLARFTRTRNDSDITQAELRALKLAVMLQVPRSARDALELGDLAGRGEAYLDNLTMALDDVYSFVHVPLKKDCLCFPEHGLVMVPFLGASPGLGLALHPSHLTVAVANPAAKWIAQLETYQRSPLPIFPYLSVGLDKCRRVVLPGSLRRNNSAEDVRAWLLEARSRGKSLIQLMLDETRDLVGTALPRPQRLR